MIFVSYGQALPLLFGIVDLCKSVFVGSVLIDLATLCRYCTIPLSTKVPHTGRIRTLGKTTFKICEQESKRLGTVLFRSVPSGNLAVSCGEISDFSASFSEATFFQLHDITEFAERKVFLTNFVYIF